MKEMYKYQRFICSIVELNSNVYKLKHVTRAVTCSLQFCSDETQPAKYHPFRIVATCSPEYYAVFPGVQGVIPFVFLVEITCLNWTSCLKERENIKLC